MTTAATKAIGSFLLQKGYVLREQLEEIVRTQAERNISFFEASVENGSLSEEQYLSALAEFLDIPYRPKIDIQVNPSILSKVPLSFIKENRLVPICEEENGNCVVAVHDPLNLAPVDDLKMLLGMPVTVMICPLAEIERITTHYFDMQNHSAAQVIMDMDEEEMGLLTTEALEERRDLLDLANEAPIIKLVNVIISQAVKERASDIHIEPYEKELRVRYRIDGVLYQVLTPPRSYHGAIVSRIKIMANLNIAERRLPQDGRIKIMLSGREIDIRVSIVPTAFGERVVMRLLDKGTFLLTLEELGLSTENLNQFARLLECSHGIILMTGPTGSGKTTTQYAALNRLNAKEKNIITVEDPIEYMMDGIAQIQVKPKIDLTFANGLRSILRQDPDIILVGEIRDVETAEMAIQASLTGHLVFSTLHTNDAAGAITRLLNMGIEPFLVSSSVVAVLAQRLVRTICPACKTSYQPEDLEIKNIGIEAERLQSGVLWRGSGCANCVGRGYRGRTGIFELLLVRENIQSLILTNVDSNTIKREAMAKSGMETLREDGAQKAIAGITTVEEVMRVTREDIV
ncbi:MAG: type II secretion system protein GspE [Candidatus Abyssobacteria bacterium SURF_17]|uniref:protein-secreting ATPase n=1 Tax=Candidatus Abyssobacteria bacterium SURF_17 TaxID=2093361 RepID=A0A419EN16_9BACT|nr:MAG: type II secretion system protein GspE [Candidatus Abyssubacteria bacterium SURF_17]